MRSVGVLTGGTLFAQGLMALSLPLLTRLYTPADFSLLAIYVSALGLITVASCLRFNIAIPLPQDDGEAMSLLLLALGSAAVVALLTALAVLIAPGGIARLMGQPGILPYLWMVPIGVFTASAYDALQYWASRKRRFGLITGTRVTRAMGGAGVQVGGGVVSSGPFCLILGHVIYGGLGVVGLTRSLLSNDRAALSSASWSTMKRAASTYRKFPLLSVPEALLNRAGLDLPILIIAATAIGPEAGFLMLAMRVMGLPVGLIGSSVAQVYLAEAPHRLRNGTIGAFTRRTMWMLLKIGGPPLLMLGVAAPVAFPLVFGGEWARAGWIVAWMTPWFVLQFVSSPISMLLHVAGKQGLALGLQALGGAFRVGAVLLAVSYDPQWTVEVYAVSGAVFYSVYIGVIFLVSWQGRSEEAP